jgi:hypothetical protein
MATDPPPTSYQLSKVFIPVGFVFIFIASCHATFVKATMSDVLSIGTGLYLIAYSAWANEKKRKSDRDEPDRKLREREDALRRRAKQLELDETERHLNERESKR